MASVLTGLVVPSCDHCISVDSSPYYLAVYALAAAGVLLGVGILVFAQGAPVKPRVWGVTAAVCFGLGLPIAAALTHFPISVHGAICGGALDAARARAFPTDAALDPTQRACKDQGQTLLDYAIVVGTAAVLGGAIMTVAASRATSTARRDPAGPLVSGPDRRTPRG
ncbi:MAG: hypothetical protein ACXVXY_13455 [Mycobacteriaceae bacterium]